MRFTEHVRNTERLLGVRGEDIHRWIDGFYDRQRIRKLAKSGTVYFDPYDHRKHRHHLDALEAAYSEFEEKYSRDVIRAVFEQHLRDDYEGYLPNKSDFEDPTFQQKYHSRFRKFDLDREKGELLEERTIRRDRLQFFVRIALPALLALMLMAITLYLVILPSFEESLMERKKETIAELTLTAHALLSQWENEYRNSSLSLEEIQVKARESLRDLRYGKERKDYFWVTTLEPRMVMHPYTPKLEGKPLRNFKDPDGKKLFVEAVRVARVGGEGFVDYRWQWHDDSTRVVPKLSHVRLFKPWGWIIGTGVYLEDVRLEIQGMTRRMVQASILLVLLVTVIMIFIGSQGYRLELNRRQVENKLLESKLRYKALVESSGEGFLMVLDGRHVYSNPVVLEMLGYTAEEFGILELHEFLSDIGGKKVSGVERFRDLVEAAELSRKLPGTDKLSDKVTGQEQDGVRQDMPSTSRFEAHLKHRDGNLVRAIVNVTPIRIGDKSGFSLILQDVSEHRQVVEKLGESEDRLRKLTENVGVGFFRLAMQPRPHLTEPNHSTLRVFGVQDEDELELMTLDEIIPDPDERERLLRVLRQDEEIRNRLLMVRRSDGVQRAISLTLLPVEGQHGIYDALMEDITEQREGKRQRDDLIEEMQSSLLVLNRSLKDFSRDVPIATTQTTIHEASRMMCRHRCSSMLVGDNEGAPLGMVTDQDMRRRVISAKLDSSEPVSRVMSSPVIGMNQDRQVFEAAILMREKGIQHLMLHDSDYKITGIFTTVDLLALQRGSSAALLRQVREAGDYEILEAGHERLLRIAQALVRGGGGVTAVSRLLSAAHDAALQRIIDFAHRELGDAPAPYSFLVFGSGGRHETTLLTDQDNALVWMDDGNNSEETRKWFLKFGHYICNRLADVGYTLCKGDNMASNPRWCQPLSEWKKMFGQWIGTPESDELLRLQIFFDFRSGAGEVGLCDELREYIHKTAEHKPAFFWNLAADCLRYRPPIGLFGNLKSAEANEEGLSLKNALKPLVGFARLQSLRHSISETGTMARLQRLAEKGVLTGAQRRSACQAFEYLVQLRLRRQSDLMEQGLPPENTVPAGELSDFERDLLKRVFEQIQSIQNQLTREYKGIG